jgi:hypothetical protein
MTPSALDLLEAALVAERDALRGQDVEALLRANAAKIGALRAAEAQGPAGAPPERLRALAEYNRENGILLARRRRAVNFALRQLGRADAMGYSPRGAYAQKSVGRSLAIA